jgi:hypothetical protein
MTDVALETVATYWYVGEAELARTALEAAGIETFIDDENLVRVDWFNANAVRGIKVRVRSEDSEAADEVLNSLPEMVEGEGGEAIEGADPKAPRSCELCGSPNVIKKTRWPHFFAISIVAIGLAIALNETMAALFGVGAFALFMLITDRWRCQDCGEQWT